MSASSPFPGARASALSVLVLLLSLGLAAGAQAQMQQMYVYSVSFECGFQVYADGQNGYEPLVKVANYATKLDLHNVGMNPAGLTAEVMATQGSRWPSSVAPVPLPANTLNSHNATVIDCLDIAQAITGGTPTGKPFFSGILTVRTLEPQIAWVTKTTQVCSGMATIDTGQPVSTPVYIDDGGLTYGTPSGATVTVADYAIFGCPSAEVDGSGNVVPPPPGQGTFRGPSGGVPPGLRPVGPVRNHQFDSSQQGGITLSNVNVSHSLDTERVEHMLIAD